MSIGRHHARCFAPIKVRCLLSFLTTGQQKLLVLHMELRFCIAHFRRLPVDKKLQLLGIHSSVLCQIGHERMPLRAQFVKPWTAARPRHGELLHAACDGLLLALRNVLAHQLDVFPSEGFSEGRCKSKSMRAEAALRVQHVCREVARGRQAVKTQNTQPQDVRIRTKYAVEGTLKDERDVQSVHIRRSRCADGDG